MHANVDSRSVQGGSQDLRVALAKSLLFAAAAALWSLPFLWPEHRIPLTSLDSELIAQACLGLMLVAGGMLLPNEIPVRWPLPSLLLGLIAVALVQYRMHHLAYAQQAVAVAWIAGAMLCAYVFGRQIVAGGLEQGIVRSACVASLLGAGASVAIQWLQLFDLHLLPSWLVAAPDRQLLQGRSFGNLAQANHLATYLAGAGVGALWLRARGLRPHWTALALLVVGSGLGLAGSRMAVAYLGVIALMLFVPNGLRPDGGRQRGALAASTLVGYLLGLAAVKLTESGADMSVLSRFAADTYGIRLELWRQALIISLQDPLLGAGAGEFSAAQYWIARVGPYVQADVNCHNVFLQLAAEMGWPVTLAAVAVVTWWGFTGLRARIRSPEGAYVWGFLALIGIHSMLEYPLCYLYFAVPACVLFGLAEPINVRESRLSLGRTIPLIGLAWLAAAIVMKLSYSRLAHASDQFWAEKMAHRPISEQSAGDLMDVAQSKLFRPQGERLFMALAQPQDQRGSEYLAMSARVLSRLAQPEAIERNILLLAQAGQVEEAVHHVDRLRVFAREKYPRYRDAILEALADRGHELDPLRGALRAAR
jgi:hypothetical protein